jgi:hypothetical protein
MNQTRNRSLSGFTACLLLSALLLLCSCMVATVYNGRPGLDVSHVKSGMSKAEVEQVLGPSIREWVTSAGIVYRVYDYDAGVPPKPGDAAAVALVDVICLGFSELIFAFKPLPQFPKREQMAVSYDSNGMVIGVYNHFGEFDALPADGRAAK